MWSALLNSKLVEDLQKLQREHETRTASSKQISKMEAWRVGSQHNLLKSYDRKEIGVSNFVFQPETFQEAELFVAPQKSQDNDPPDEIAFCKKLKEVIRLEAVSPIFMYDACKKANAGITLKNHPPTSVLDHHMETGFSGLKESALRRLSSDLGITETSCGSDVPEEVALAANLMLNVNPLLTESSVVGKLLLRQETPGHAMVGSEESLDEAVKDTVLTGDAEKILSHVKACSESKLKEHFEKKKKVAHIAFGKVMDSIPLEKIKAAKAKLSKTPKKDVPSTGSSSAKDQKRVYDKLKSSIDAVLRQNVPDKV
eukprot:s1600_g26.t1